MIPEFDPRTGYLPPGVHKAQWAEVVQRFGTNERRRRLLFGLGAAVVNFAMAGCRSILLDGSFIIDKPLPGDYDGVWEPRGVNVRLIDPVLRDLSNRRKAMKNKYGGEFFPADLIEMNTGVPFRDFFQTDENKKPKGIVEIDPGELLQELL